MKIKITTAFLCFFLITGLSLRAQVTRVLFIGNSYTYVNDLPGTFSQLALSFGDSIYYDSSTPGGHSFNNHINNTTSLNKIAQPGWDYVVLQGQSQEPAFPPTYVANMTYPYAAQLDSLVHLANPCAHTMFYMTWGRKYGDADNCAAYPPICTFEGMTQRLRTSYLEMATDNYSTVAPAGIAWRNARMADSTINLWSGDNSHPSVAGTYLTACVFYASIFKQSPVGSSYTAGLPLATATFLQNIARQTVLDSLDTWMLNQDPIHADYSFIVNNNQVQFNADTYNASSFQWDFDDTQQSSNQNPAHTYGATGTFQVQLIASNTCYSDTVTQPVTITSLSAETVNTAAFSVYPNPATHTLYIQTAQAENIAYRLYTIDGKLVSAGTLVQQSLDISALDAGIYILEIGKSLHKIIKQ